MTSTSLIPRLFLALALAGLFGCKQEAGDTCREDNDCSGALVCCKPTAGATQRGTCRPEGEECSDVDPDPIDFGPPEEIDLGTDLGPVDMGDTDMGEDDADGGPESDLGPGDLGTDESDGGPGDMGEADLGDEDMG